MELILPLSFFKSLRSARPRHRQSLRCRHFFCSRPLLFPQVVCQHCGVEPDCCPHALLLGQHRAVVKYEQLVASSDVARPGSARLGPARPGSARLGPARSFNRSVSVCRALGRIRFVRLLLPPLVECRIVVASGPWIVLLRVTLVVVLHYVGGGYENHSH